MFTLRFDMRSQSPGTGTSELYAAACEMCAWAEVRGCAAAVLCEHHCADDGYLPSPLLLASAIAARTKTLLLNLTIILPFYDPARLAEDIAVLDHISAGRATYIFGIGYRQEEYDHFGLSLTERGRLADEKLGILRRLLNGEVVEHDGRRMLATPQPRTPGGPMMMWGGASMAAARRAGRNGLGLLANGVVPGMREAYEKACCDNGFEIGFVMLPERDTITNCFVAEDVDQAWDEIGRYLLHDALSYSQWNPDNQVSANITTAKTVDELRRTSQTHAILSIGEAAERLRDGEVFNISPLCGGIPPEIAWPYLERFVELNAKAVVKRR
ncbi:luciferase [Mycobacterium intracellulare]|uniref:LLM class flavin-dependent oxidoreductase n=1 Tax=Mycobacterium intracellulare TaxID=1767 RepID=UPI0007EB34CD|nr:LLM class flavin-dependent oxidoreductase [Mycobacterium intracellulare]OBH73955.1 luciferase [Mycobacterium intracellulare]